MDSRVRSRAAEAETNEAICVGCDANGPRRLDDDVDDDITDNDDGVLHDADDGHFLSGHDFGGRMRWTCNVHYVSK